MRVKALAGFLAVATPLLGVAAPQTQSTTSSSRNGIAVGAPKVYEESALRAMLEAAEKQLAEIRAISSTAVEAAVGKIQGTRQETTSFSLTAQPLPVPGSTTSSERTLNASGELVTSKITDNIASPQISPTPAPLPTPGALTTTGFGLGARDLLTEQTALAYQIATLRLALARATTDRLTGLTLAPKAVQGLAPTSGAAQSGKPATAATAPPIRVVPRYPFVLGFSVGIDRPVKDHLAEVELTLQLSGTARGDIVDDKSPRPLSLVAALPAKDAYNVAAITDSSVNIGAAQIVSVVQLGASFLRSRKTYYVVRDVDTIATEAHSTNAREVKVRWQFRPVLGRRTVEPGPRQVFVVLTVDEQRFDDLKLTATAKTGWSRLSRQGVVQKPREAYLDVPLGEIGYWEIFSTEAQMPLIDDAKLTLLSDSRAYVEASGAFLSPESKVFVGNLTLDRGTGLELSRENNLAFVVPLQDLATAADVFLSNRFLRAGPLRAASQGQITLRPGNCSYAPDTVGSCCSAVPISGSDKYRVTADLEADSLPSINRLVAIAGDTVLTGSADLHQRTFGLNIKLYPAGEPRAWDRGTIKIRPLMSVQFEVPTAAIRKQPKLVIREIFGGPERRVECALPLLPWVETASVVARDKDAATIALQGRALRQLKTVLMGAKRLKLPDEALDVTDAMILLRVPWSELLGVEKLLTRNDDAWQVVAFNEKPQARRPTIATKVSVVEGFSGVVEIEGDDLDSVKKVSFEDLELESKVEKSRIAIYIVSRVTEKVAPRTLRLDLVDGSKQYLPITITAKPTA